VIDYTWLMDKFESETLAAEEKRKEPPTTVNVNNISTNSTANAVNAPAYTTITNSSSSTSVMDGTPKQSDDVTAYLRSDDEKQTWYLSFDSEAPEDEVNAKAELLVGQPLTEKMKKALADARREGYAGRFSGRQQPVYKGGYYGSEELSLSLLPEFLRADEMTEWLFTYQMQGEESYLYSLQKYRSTETDLWLMTALSKAKSSSAELSKLLEAATRSSRTSPAYPTIAYNAARIYLELGKNAEARGVIDEMLNSSADLPISSVNRFKELRSRMAETLDDFLKYSLKKPFAFDNGGTAGTIDEFIATQKSWYNPEYNKNGKDAYEQEIDYSFRNEIAWKDRLMFDSETVETINRRFSQSVLLEAERSPSLPDYMRERFATVIWMRAYLLGDNATEQKIAPELKKYHPEFEELLRPVEQATTPAARQYALLYFVMKNPMLTPYLEEGAGKPEGDFEGPDFDVWWCEPYDSEDVAVTGPIRPHNLAFLTAAQTRPAEAERRRLKAIGDAPIYFGARVLDWAAKAPADKRVPEVLYMIFATNGWSRSGCGNNTEIRQKAGSLLKTRYPLSDWTRRVIADESSEN